MTSDSVAKASPHAGRWFSSFVLLFPLVWLLAVYIVSKTSLSARIYNVTILSMTSTWYHAVLSSIPPHSTVLDVGIGTAGALIKNKHVILEKSLSIMGVDVSPQYVDAAKRAVSNTALQDHVQVACHSIYDIPSIQTWLKETTGTSVVDAVYFSGSFSLLPDPLEALNTAAQQLLEPGGIIYITQTYASSESLFGKITKPLVKYLTTIDFGQLVTNEQVMHVFEQSNLTVVAHAELQQTNAHGLSPSAFLTVLQVPFPGLDESCNNGTGETCSEQ